MDHMHTARDEPWVFSAAKAVPGTQGRALTHAVTINIYCYTFLDLYVLMKMQVCM